MQSSSRPATTTPACIPPSVVTVRPPRPSSVSMTCSRLLAAGSERDLGGIDPVEGDLPGNSPPSDVISWAVPGTDIADQRGDAGGGSMVTSAVDKDARSGCRTTRGLSKSFRIAPVQNLSGSKSPGRRPSTTAVQTCHARDRKRRRGAAVGEYVGQLFGFGARSAGLSANDCADQVGHVVDLHDNCAVRGRDRGRLVMEHRRVSTTAVASARTSATRTVNAGTSNGARGNGSRWTSGRTSSVGLCGSFRRETSLPRQVLVREWSGPLHVPSCGGGARDRPSRTRLWSARSCGPPIRDHRVPLVRRDRWRVARPARD